MNRLLHRKKNIYQAFTVHKTNENIFFFCFYKYQTKNKNLLCNLSKTEIVWIGFLTFIWLKPKILRATRHVQLQRVVRTQQGREREQERERKSVRESKRASVQEERKRSKHQKKWQWFQVLALLAYLRFSQPPFLFLLWTLHIVCFYYSLQLRHINNKIEEKILKTSWLKTENNSWISIQTPQPSSK